MDPADEREPGRQRSGRAVAAVTATGTLLVGLGTLIGAFLGRTDTGTAKPSPTATVTVTRTVSAGATGGAQPTRAPEAGARWRGNVLITENGTDLDVVPADNNAGSDGDIADYGFLEVGGESLRWRTSADPNRQQCADRLRTHASTDNDYTDPTPGMRICLRTDGGRIALLTVKKDDSDGISVDVTVWKGPDG